MPVTAPLPIRKLALDLGNYRTLPQPSEQAALEAMVSSRPDQFWALTESLLQDGYLPTESIIVLTDGKKPSTNIVKEGNRRIAALKLLHGQLSSSGLAVPSGIAAQIKKVSATWKQGTKQVPCTVYKPNEAQAVDRIVALTHGKGEKAGRDHWNAVARARHNRALGKAEPALNLLEAYLDKGQNLTAVHKARWAGDFPLTVLSEAMKKIAPRVGVANGPALAAAYPNIAHRDAMESVIHDIGSQALGFDDLRREGDALAVNYGFPAQAATKGTANKGQKGSTKQTAGSAQPGSKASSGSTKPAAISVRDPRGIRRHLQSLQPVGNHRDKVVTLRDEAIALDIKKTTLAFCFLLRSMFEISAKAYCLDHKADKLSAKKTDGTDRNLVDVLRDVTVHMTKKDPHMKRVLHGSMTELARPDGLLSVTSMNQLVHNPAFSVNASDVAIVFSNIFPLLQAMNV